MVAKANHNKTCNQCGSDLVCPECGVPSKRGTPFSNWIRSTEIEASCHDIDFVWHNYRENWFMTLEEKTHLGKMSFSQRDTQGIVFQMLRASSGRECLTARGWNPIEYRGHHIITFENTDPSNGSIWIDGSTVTEEELIYFLETGRSPCATQETEIAEREDTLQAPPS